MLWLLAASGGLRSLKGADTVSRLASAEYWDEVGSNYDESDGFGVADPPRVPPESVLQDVLRDVFDTGGAGRKARKTSGGKDSNTASMGNQSAKNANGGVAVSHAAQERAAAQSARQGRAARDAVRERPRGRHAVATVRPRGSVRALGPRRSFAEGGKLGRKLGKFGKRFSRNSARRTRVRSPPKTADAQRVHTQARGSTRGGVCGERGVRPRAHAARWDGDQIGDSAGFGRDSKLGRRDGGRLERRPRRRARRVERSVSDEQRRRVGRPGRRHRPGVHARRRDRR